MPSPLSTLGPWFGVIALVLFGSAAGALLLARRRGALQGARLAHAGCTLGALILWVVLAGFEPMPFELIEVGPISDLHITLLSVTGSWLLLGTLLWVADRGVWTLERVIFWLSVTLLTGLALNVVRERFIFGDVADYVRAAEQMSRGEALHGRYLYPPLLATLLAPLIEIGPRAVFVTCTAANLVALVLLFVLLRRTLRRYDFAELSATILSFAALVANVAVLRTLFYVQMNLHMANLMLLSLLCYPTQPLLSAVALAFAVHIKTSPLALALPFLLNRDWKWLAYFVLALLGLVGFTSAINGFVHYGEYLDNIANVYRANGFSLRDNSIDSLVRGTLQAVGEDLEHSHLPVLALKAALFAFALWLCALCIKNRSFTQGSTDPRADVVLNSYPVLMLLLTTVSPLVWEHHPVLIVASLLVMLKLLDNEADLVLWLLGWFLIYLVPTFDVYPFSYRVAVGAVLVYWLLCRLARRKSTIGRPFLRIDAWLRTLPGPRLGEHVGD